MSIYLSKGILIYCIFLMFIIGSVMGSFLNCVAYRIAHHTSFLKGRSHCPNCDHVLGPLDLIPIFSWIFSKGKCRYCQQPISKRYPLTEICMAVLSVLCLLRFDLSIECIRNYILICILFTLSLVDLEIFEIPDTCILLGIVNWIVFAFFLKESIVYHLVAAFVYGGGILVLSLFMDKLLKKESMGGGDIKLLFVMGLYLGNIGGMLALFLACIIGICTSIFMKKDEENHFPFGPAISIAFYIVLLFGKPMIDWYIGIL